MTVSTASVTPRSERARLSAADWERGALDLIAEQGVAAVAVEPLARRLGVTKGSFYWHFTGRDELLAQALKRWEVEDQSTIQAIAESNADAREQLRALIMQTTRELRSHVIYAALLKAADHLAVQPVLSRTTQRRISVLRLAFEQAGMERIDAAQRARLVYTTYVGFLQLNLELNLLRLDHDDFEAYIQHLIRTLLP